MLRRTIAATGVVALALSLLAPVALASGPTRVYLPIDGPIEFAAGDPCAFPLRIDILVNTEYGVTFRDDAGNVVRQIVGGRLIISLTNESTGATITENISGPMLSTIHPDGSSSQVLLGNSLPFGPGEMWLTTGAVHVETDASGTITSITQHGGTRQNVCALLG
ncbi:MAG TPA: hypothetical protein VFQ75_12805 [Candidatus Limnocylindrales bacterium]|nr:hypothetical protein [Candidatus Limnocylindrales bacterium]